MVVIIHTGAFADFGAIGQNITNGGKYGVQIFFVISGFSIAATFAGAANFSEFFTRRIFRIVPLYWLVITLVSALTVSDILLPNYWQDYFGTSITWRNYLLHVAFLSSLDHTIGNTILGVEWTIPIELFWYILLPLILIRVRTARQFAVAFLLAFAAIAATRAISDVWIPEDPALFAKWFPTTYGPDFLLGVLAYRVRNAEDQWLQSKSKWLLPTVLILSLGNYLGGGPGRGVLLSIATFLMIGLFDSTSYPRFARILLCKPLLFTGTISYSLYLTHFPIALFLSSWMQQGGTLFLATYATSIMASTVLYVLVERPANAWGRSVSRLFCKQQVAVGPSVADSNLKAVDNSESSSQSKAA